MKEFNQENTQNNALKPASKQRLDAFSVRTIFDLLVANWYWYFGSMIVFGVLMGFYIKTIPYTYRHQTIVLMDATKSDQDRSRSDASGLYAPNTDLVNQMFTLHSINLMQKVAKRINLDVNYSHRLGFRNEDLFGDLPFQIKYLDPYDPSINYDMVVEF